MDIFYGYGDTYLNVTDAALTYCYDGSRIYIAAGDTGSMFFPDPLPGYLKNIIMIREFDGVAECRCFEPKAAIWVVPTDDESRKIRDFLDRSGSPRTGGIERPPATFDTASKISFFHSQLKFTGGDITHEWQEQAMVVNFLDPDARVLELGSNIGRNTLMISCILNDPRNLVTVECNPFFVELLRNNRYANRLDFHIEAGALSYRKLMQSTDNCRFGSDAEAWEAIPAEELPDGYEWIPTVTFADVETKYDLRFDTLVADCEGALFYILQDDPELLTNITTIILESDFRVVEQKWAVEQIFAEYGFERVHSVALVPNLTELPQECADSFWEVWKRKGKEVSLAHV